MSANTQSQYRDRLLIEIIADYLRIDVLAERLPGPDLYPPYLLVVLGIGIEYGVFDLYNYFISNKNSFVTEPNSLAVPAMVLLAVVGARYIHDSYAEAMSTLRVEDRETDVDPHLFHGLISFRIRVATYLLVVGAQKSFAIFGLGIPTLIEINGIGTVLFAQLIGFPLIYLPVLVEFILAYFSVHLAVPRRLRQANIGVFFYDPRKMGGFAPIGELLKRSYYLYTAALLLYFVQTQGPIVLSKYMNTPYPVTQAPITEIVLSVGWVIGILTIAYSISRVHTIMKTEKEQRILELESKMTEAMENEYDIHAAEIADPDQYEDARERLQHVRETKTYPTTFTMWSQIFVSVLLPQALNVVV